MGSEVGSKVKLGFLVLFGALFVVSAFYFVQAVTTPEKISSKVTLGEYRQMGRLDYEAELKPNLVYGVDEIESGSIVYPSLVNNMSLAYTYAFEAENGSVSGSYVIKLLLAPEKGQWTKVLEKRAGSFTNTFTEVIPLNWTAILATWGAIEKETKYNFGSPRVVVLTEVKAEGVVGGKDMAIDFTHSPAVVYGKALRFDELTKEDYGKVYTESTIANRMGVLGGSIEVSRAKTIFGSLLGFSLLAFVGSAYMSREEIKTYVTSRKDRAFYRKYGKIIFATSTKPEIDKVIRLEDVESLGRISYELDRPIISYNNELMVIDGDTAYVVSRDS